MRKGRKLRKFEWEKILGRKAWTAQELAPIIGISPICMRRYLRIYTFLGRLERKRFGVFWYYVVKRFLEPPDVSYPCPFCHARMDLYRVKRCGCEFHMCPVSEQHCKFSYCKKHQIMVTVKKESVAKEVKLRE